MLVASVGYIEAANRTGIKYATIRQWAKRGKWNQPVATDSRSSRAVTLVTSPAQAQAEALADMGRETRHGLAKLALESVKRAKPVQVRTARDAKDLASLIQTVDPQGQEQGQITLNVLNVAGDMNM